MVLVLSFYLMKESKTLVFAINFNAGIDTPQNWITQGLHRLISASASLTCLMTHTGLCHLTI